MQAAARRQLGAILPFCSVWLLVGASPVTADTWPRYNSGCQNCHGNFTSSTSPRGTVFPMGDKHEMHRNSAYMATACNLCHTTGDNRDPFLASSNGTATTPGRGCLGCHGQNFGGAIGVTGAGLRAHHARHNVTVCVTCHTTDPTPLPESSMPPYYGSVDTRANDPCNRVHTANTGENWSVGDTIGLDNDGDGLYDTADFDCRCPGDVNGDNVINESDLGLVLSNWLNGAGGDVTGDGQTDEADMGLLLSNWLRTCP